MNRSGTFLVLQATLKIMTMEDSEVAGEADRRTEGRSDGQAGGQTDKRAGE